MRPTRRPVLFVAFAVWMMVVLPSSPVGAWEVDPAAGPGSLVDFHQRFSLMAYPYPRHKAEPLGWVGFEIYGEAAAVPDVADDASIRNATDGSLPGDALAVYRVGARKGLPGKIDIGASLAKTLDGDIDLVSAELSWAIFEGSVATPALQLRLTGTQTLDAGVYDLEMYGAELLLSKGFPIVTPYVGIGTVYSEGTFDRSALAVPGAAFSTDGTDFVGYVGATFNFALFKITAEVERGVELHGAVRFSVGIQ